MPVYFFQEKKNPRYYSNYLLFVSVSFCMFLSCPFVWAPKNAYAYAFIKDLRVAKLKHNISNTFCILLEQNPWFWINVHRGGGWLQSVLPRVLKEEVTTQVGTKERNKSFARMYMICVLPTASFWAATRTQCVEVQALLPKNGFWFSTLMFPY